MANPRKFSEKIAIQNQKAMEGNQAFDDIMREVSETKMREFVKLKVKYRGGSLPNVNFNVDMQNSVDNVQDMSPNRSGFVDHRYRRNLVSRPTHSHRARMETSPYYARLMPSQEGENSWRRVHSDSSIHQTLTQNPNQPQRDMQVGVQNNKSGFFPGRQIDKTRASMLTDGWQKMVSSPPQLSKSPENTFMTGFPARRLSDRSNVHHMQMQANTGSLPDLSSLHIPSPLQTPLDLEESQHKAKGMQSPNTQGHFPMPMRVAPRRHPSNSCGKQFFPRQLSSPDGDSDKKVPPLFLGADKGQDMSQVMQPGPPPGAMSPTMQGNLYWNTPISPLATEAFLQQLQQQSSPAVTNPYNQNDLQAQLQQIQMKDGGGMYDPIGMNQPPPPYTATMEPQNPHGNFDRNLMRSSNGVPEIVLSDHLGPKDDFSREFGNAMGIISGYSQQKNEITDEALNSVRVGLDPLNFEDVQILSGENPDVVDQSTEEQFRLERVSFQQ